jgi:plasmid maintenance system antidote protein VapI
MLVKAQSPASKTIISSIVEGKSLLTKKTTLNLSPTFSTSLQVEE